jgi:hypothetical protein
VATSFYTYVGQMVPQKEVLPPQETVIRADLTTDDMVKVGQEIMNGKGLCFTCHTLGKTRGRSGSRTCRGSMCARRPASPA